MLYLAKAVLFGTLSRLDERTVCLPLYGLALFVNNTSNTVQNNSVRAKLSGQHNLITLARASLAFSAILDM